MFYRYALVTLCAVLMLSASRCASEQNNPATSQATSEGNDMTETTQVEKLIIEELQLQLADRAGVRISDSELNQTPE